MKRRVNHHALEGVYLRKSSAIRLGLVEFGLAFAASVDIAVVQAAPYPIPPDTMVVTPGGVDMRSGHYAANHTDLSIGTPSVGGLEFARLLRNASLVGIASPPLGQFSHNWQIYVSEKTRQPLGSGFNVSVVVGATTVTFYTSDHVTFQLISLIGDSSATLTRTASGSNYYYTYRTMGGKIITFNPSATGVGAAVSVALADGTVFTISYGAQGIAQITSNAGYALILEYNPASGATNSVSKVCALNLTSVTLPGTFSCPTGVPSVSYSYQAPLMNSVTDPVGATSQITSSYTNSSTSYVERFINPGDTIPYLINSYFYDSTFGKFYITDQAYSDGHTYHYDWTELGAGEAVTGTIMIGTGYTDNASNHTAFTWQTYQNIMTIPPAVTPGPVSLTDALSRTTNFTYDAAFVRLTAKTMPLGLTDRFTYDGFNNVTQKRSEPNTGSVLAPIIVNATYDCATLINCNKPATVTDARSNVTNYTYDPVHGGALTEAAPADVNGIRPVKRYAYAQRYAWIKSGGSYVHAASPIWVRTEERSCRTTATVGNACSGGTADEIVTANDYGPDAGPNNLMLRGNEVTANGTTLRTCYTYDLQGNKISETSPRANLATCP